METKKISNNMLARMPIYLNYIKALPKSTKNISATKIAGALGFGEVSVRKDLAKVSDGGRCKMGYVRDELIRDIESFLGIKSTMNAIVAGKGEMLQTLLNYENFEYAGLKILAAFDADAEESRSVKGKQIYPVAKLQEFCSEHRIQIGILIASSEDAQQLCDQLVSMGVEGIWNFTPVHLEVPSNIVLQNESFTASISKMRLQLQEKKEALEI